MRTIGGLLEGMRDGNEQSDDDIAEFVRGVVDGTVTRPQAAAWLAWAYARGLSDGETLALTRSMTRSGDVLQWPEGSQLIDKHSTGGVGDKVSLVLAPLWAAMGRRVPMISGRGLGHTGGTLDKLEAIEGYRCDLSVEELRAQLDEVGCFISGQTGEIAPADRVLYALRNETTTVPSIPLIVASILSKKLAEGVQRLVLDVKTGSGAFMKTLPQSRALAEALVRVATLGGAHTSAVISEMGRPLGNMVGNALEVAESVDCLKGEGPQDLRDLVLALAGDPDAASVLDSGRAMVAFERMVAAQGGDPSSLHAKAFRGAGVSQSVVVADRSGVLSTLDALDIGHAAFELGAGRRHASAAVDPGVGIELLAKPGDDVVEGEVLARLFHRDGRALELATSLTREAFRFGDGASPPPLIHAVIEVS